MAPIKDSYCSYCGTAYTNTVSYPRTCSNCHVTVWANPIPVAVALVPINVGNREGLLVVRRAIEPGKGMVALVGGFVEEHETWQQGAAREVVEETGVVIDASHIEPFWFVSTHPRPNRVLLFCTANPLSADAIAPFQPDSEASERGVVFGPEGLGELFAFPHHAEAARRWFAARGLSGPHAYTVM